MKFLSSALALSALGKVDHAKVKEHCKKFTFCETFQDGDEFKNRWNVVESGKFKGKWAIEKRKKDPLEDDDTALIVKDKANHHAIATDFPSIEGGDLTMQYELKLQEGQSCGGSYVKMFSGTKDKFDNETPYIIMFGPDKCGYTNKVHFILRHENPKTKEWIEHHLSNPPKIKDDTNTHVYSLHVSKDNTFEISIDQEVATTGDLLKDMTPPIIPPQKIKDADDIKPKDWEDNEEIDDPHAKKPEDWDNDAPAKIPDPDAKKPDEWDEDAPHMVPDADAKKPEDWDAEEDGEWEAPKIPNPKCKEGGCGKWEAPMIKNPDHKGRWTAPKIKNPKYKGPWIQKEIDNPAYFESASPGVLPAISAIGYELWTMSEDIAFDHIIVGSGPASKGDAAEFATLTSKERRDAEEEAEKAKKEEADAALKAKKEDEDLNKELNVDEDL